jgi:hypothetical protein
MNGQLPTKTRRWKWEPGSSLRETLPYLLSIPAGVVWYVLYTQYADHELMTQARNQVILWNEEYSQHVPEYLTKGKSPFDFSNSNLESILIGIAVLILFYLLYTWIRAQQLFGHVGDHPKVRPIICIFYNISNQTHKILRVSEFSL